MKNPAGAGGLGVTAELLALQSIAVACSSADKYLNSRSADLNKFAPEASAAQISTAQRKDILQESILFHHFMATTAVLYVLHHDLKSRNQFCDRMTAAINPRMRFPPNEELGLSPLTIFSAKDREDAIKSCFFSPGNIVACLTQELYLGRRPSESEMKVMNLNSVREMTGWDSPSANTMQYFAAAFLARLTISIGNECLVDKYPVDFMFLSFYAVAQSKAAFKLYIESLGAEVVTEGDETGAHNTSAAKRNWLSRLFR